MVLEMPLARYQKLKTHLLPRRCQAEEAAFLFCQSVPAEGSERFSFLESYLVPVTDFIHRSLFALELSDLCRARVIKRAHQLSASLIEIHSHPLGLRTLFSSSDLIGFADFVPHVWWRLKGRPYAAIVVGPSGFDSLCWLSNPKKPDAVLELDIAGQHSLPTGLTLSRWEEEEGHGC